MAKTQEELNKIKEEVETLNNKLKELTDEELKQVAGGVDFPGLTLPGNLRLPSGADPSLPPQNEAAPHRTPENMTPRVLNVTETPANLGNGGLPPATLDKDIAREYLNPGRR